LCGLALRHFDQQLARTPLGAHPDLGRLGDERRILGLFGVGLHGDRLVADALNLINAVSLRQRAAGGVVADQEMAASGLRSRTGTSYCHGVHISLPGEQPHAAVGAPGHDAKAVVLDLGKPAPPCGRLLG
jgi:hypothetical protein